ncbi:ArsR/SmtB family transcription factor [Glycomyces tritici]|uniref:Helix-turn-helix domain-containing protein n=1 Tax=Glycomyces tritici TaxID=2665176 RepID=A0ABT7YV72_9ACTN|nr:helix-turn-helix domain-containing protein [Glycomyces tritici]MDN3242492.1 helix-turn-helix domain-containing protein [Glycomyces tritici]
MDAPEAEELTLSTPQQYRALGHPVRHRLLFTLGQDSATLSRLATDLGISKGSVAHHLKVLREAGLVRLDSTRKVRGGTEQRFKRTAARLRFDDEEATKAALAAVADQMRTDDDPLFMLRSIRLSEPQARRLRETLEELVKGLSEEDGEERYGVLVGLYRPQAGPVSEG